MTLQPGTSVGPYEVVAVVGAGGMGEVYRARDTRLKRDVALKILPEAFSADPDRLARFQREAELLAALNHSNIAAIYGLEHAPSVDGTAIRALILELVEGETLADRIARGPVPAGEALGIAVQIAAALEAAHEQGIIHRDLKPANVKVRPDGTVKVLDFGLAKLNLSSLSNLSNLSNPSNPSNPSMSPTITTPALMTGLGAILGTAAYMSPEQAKGREVDRRSDVWGFGCVLFEMLSGRRAFESDDVGDTYAAVLRGEPDWSAIPVSVPRPVVALVRRCLEKDRRKRIGDVASALAMLDDAALTMPPHPAAPSRPWRRRLWTAAAVIAAAVVAAGATVWVTRPAESGVTRLTITLPDAQPASVSGEARIVAISHDGRRVAYVGPNGGLFVRALGELEPTLLAPAENAFAPFFSPDGESIGYFRNNIDLRRVQVAGGPSVVLSRTDAGRPGGGTWTEDGSVVFATTGPTGLLVSAPGATSPRTLTTPDRKGGEADHLWPERIPGTRSVLFTITSTTGVLENAQIAVADIDTGVYRAIVPGGTHAHYVSSGHLVYSAGGTLRAVPFDRARLETVGSSVSVLPRVLTTATGASNFGVAANGTLVYGAGGIVASPERELVWVRRDGQLEPLGAARRAYIYPRISPNGAGVLLDSRDDDNDIWLWDIRLRSLTNVTANPALDRYPLWTPDGEHVVFVSDREGGRSAIYRQRVDGIGEAERMSELFDVQPTPNAIVDGGKHLVFDHDADLLLLALDGSRRVTPLVSAPAAERRAAVSRDGRWIAYQSDESDRIEVYVRPLSELKAGAKTQISIEGGFEPWWHPTINELFYIAPTGNLMGVLFSETRPTAARVVLDARPFFFNSSGSAAATFDVAADGRFLMIRRESREDANLATLMIVQNWTDELKRLVPP